MDKVKLLYIITRLDRGGSSEMVLLTLLRLNQEKFDITIMSGPSREPDEKLIESVKKKGVRFIFDSFLVRGPSPVKDFLTLLKIFFLIKKEKFDIIHTHTSKAGILGRIAAKWTTSKDYRPIIIHTPHGHVFYGYYGVVLSKLFLILEKLAASFTDKIIALTEKEIDEYLQFGISRNRAKFISIPNGLDLNRIANLKIDPVRKRKEFGLPEEVKLIGSAGRLELVKGYKYFIEASLIVKKSFPNCLFLLIGDGSLCGELQHQIEKLNLWQNFKILGWRDDVNEIISLLDVFVLSSLNEGMGLVLVEAMAMGKPVVATNVGGIPSVVIDGETGILVPPKNPDAIAEAIIFLLQNPEKMKKMGEAGKERTKLFSIEVMIEKTQRLYEELLENRNNM